MTSHELTWVHMTSHELTWHHMSSHDITWLSHDVPHYCSSTSGCHQGSGNWGSVYGPLYVTRTHRDTNLPRTATHPSQYSQTPKREKHEKHSTLQHAKLTGACSLKYLINIPTWGVFRYTILWVISCSHDMQISHDFDTQLRGLTGGTLRLTGALAYLVSCLAMTAEETNFPSFTMAHSIQTQVTSSHTKLRRKGPCTTLVHKCCYI